MIIGPGSQNVFVEGSKVSLVGDVITSHGKGAHSNARTEATQGKVFVGTGFAVDSISTGDAPKPDLKLESFSTNYPGGTQIELYASGTGLYPPTNMQNAYVNCFGPGVLFLNLPTPPTLVYSYEVKNDGIDTSQPFTVGFWKFNDVDTAPSQAILTVAASGYTPGVELVEEQEVGALAPGQSFQGQFTPFETYPVGAYVFGVYPDIYQTVTEPDEQNSAPTIKVTVSPGCG